MIKLCHFNLMLCIHLFLCASIQSEGYQYTGVKFHEKEALYFRSDETHNIQSSKSFRFASYYQDHMVLQRHPNRAVIWGYGNVNSAVTVKFEDSVYEAGVIAGPGNVGIWKIILMSHVEGGPYNITATQSYQENVTGVITLSDVYFGEVWVCSGQSNMQMSLTVIINSSYELNQTVFYPHVRVFYVQDLINETEQIDLNGITMPWTIPSPDNMKSFSAVCWLYGKYLYDKLKVPIGLVHSAWGGTPVETWSSLQALKSCGLDKSKVPPLPSPVPQNNSLLWNAMIHPLLNLTIKGVIWYQGEQNTIYHKSHYNCSFPAMIHSWRQNWYEGTFGNTDKEFPFGFVQLSVLNEPNWLDDGAYPEIRWHQTADIGYSPNSKMPNTFMAVTIDLLDTRIPAGSPHYRDKQDVSHRLMLGAMHYVYNDKSLISDGPYPISFSHISVDELAVKYSIEQHLVVQATQSFQVCCIPNHCDKFEPFVKPSWTNSSVKSWSDHHIFLNTSDCAYGVSAVRYAWSVTPCAFKQCQVYNQQGLPAAPFWFKV